ncbi:MAG: AraC family transcriptional regulator [Pedobacter sp.]|nr:MAG: AraC family transcriptional regulator [Pedobacter sp.]
MSYNIDGSDFGDFLVEQDIDTVTRPKPIDALSEQIRFRTPKGDILFEQYPIKDHLSVLTGRYQFREDILINGAGDSSLLEMHFNLSDHAISYKNRTAKKGYVAPMTGNLTFLAAEDNKAKIGFMEDTWYNTFDIHLPLETIMQYEGESKKMDLFLNNIQKNISATLAKDEIRIGAKEFCVIEDIKNCKYTGLTRRIYLESKVYELLALGLNGLETDLKTIKLSNGDSERIKYVAQVIRENLDTPFTILELARMVNINQTKLKEGFKSIFGNTVFGYLQEIRMNMAKKYLLETKTPVQEISFRLGYQNVSNFSIAFKKTFGYPPTRLRNSIE